MIALLLLLCCSTAQASIERVTVYSPPCILHVSDGREIVLTAQATYWQWPSRVQITSAAVFNKPLPPCPVRIGLVVKRRYEGYWFGWDGYKQGKSAKWVKILDANSLKLAVGSAQIVDGRVETRGVIRRN